MDKKRLIYIDLLRIAATIAVVTLHVCSISWYKTDIAGFRWNLLNVIDSLCRWTVPCFVMISGALFLSPEKKFSVRKLYTKNTMRIITSLIFWTFMYFLLEKYVLETKFTDLKSYEDFLSGYKHLWYLFLVVGLYIMTPILRKITEDRKSMKYFLVVSFIFGILAFNINKIILPLIPSAKYENTYLIIKYMATAYGKMHLDYIVQYTFYYVAGYALSTADFRKSTKIILIAAGLVAAILTMQLTKQICLYNHKYIIKFYEYCSLNVMLESFGIFILFRSIHWPDNKIFTNTILHFSKVSFGIYLVHRVFIFVIDKNYVNYADSPTPVLTLIKYLLITLVLSYIVSAILNKIPVLKKYIV